VLYISGNGTGKLYNQSNATFASGPELTWQDNVRNFQVLINPSELFDR
jgi:hypothetical protein